MSGKINEKKVLAASEVKGKVPDAAESLLESFNKTVNHAETTKAVLGKAIGIYDLKEIGDVSGIADAKAVVKSWEDKIRRLSDTLEAYAANAAKLKPEAGKLEADLLQKYRKRVELDQQIMTAELKIAGTFQRDGGLWLTPVWADNFPYYVKYSVRYMKPQG